MTEEGWLKPYLEDMKKDFNRRFDSLEHSFERSLDSHIEDDSKTFQSHASEIRSIKKENEQLKQTATKAHVWAKIGAWLAGGAMVILTGIITAFAVSKLIVK